MGPIANLHSSDLAVLALTVWPAVLHPRLAKILMAIGLSSLTSPNSDFHAGFGLRNHGLRVLWSCWLAPDLIHQNAQPQVVCQRRQRERELLWR